MIYIGLTAGDKSKVIRDKMSEYRKTYVFVSDKYANDLDLSGDFEVITYSEVILYRFFYRLLGEINKDSLIVVNEFIKSRKRSDLTYNCLAKYINQCGETLVFNFAPLISEAEDFMILSDMETRGQSRLSSFSREFWKNTLTFTSGYAPVLDKIEISVSKADRDKYSEMKKKLIDNLGERDPQTIPRNLHLYTGTLKAKSYTEEIICRNKRLGRGITYDDVGRFNAKAAICDFPVSERDLWNYLYHTRQERIIALIAKGLPVDKFYFDRYQQLFSVFSDFNGTANLFA
jgi:hypothetical protein